MWNLEPETFSGKVQSFNIQLYNASISVVVKDLIKVVLIYRPKHLQKAEFSKS